MRFDRAFVGVTPKLEFADLISVDLIGAIGQPEKTSGGVHRGQAKIVVRASATEGLDGPVDDPARHIRHGDLDHRDLALRFLVAHRVHHVSCLQRQKS